MDDTTKNFLEVWNNWQYEPPKPVFYRCYYRDDGTVITYSMEELPGNYIEVDRETFLEFPTDVRIQNGKLIRLPKASTVSKLWQDDHGTPCHPQDITIIVSPDQPCIKWRYGNETN